MLAIAISLLFGVATFAAVAVIHASIVQGIRRAPLILAELSGEPRPASRIWPRIRPESQALPTLPAAA
jgi:hypothetical protein